MGLDIKFVTPYQMLRYEKARFVLDRFVKYVERKQI
ncbi:MAG TPA: hypothetical protein PLW37_04325 [bacterium]|nr:hypothetical protein [bacterium]